MKQIYILHSNNKFSHSIIVDDSEIIENSVDHSWTDENKTLFIPLWNGIEWIESATQEEINRITNTIQPKTEVEILREKLAIQDGAIMELAEIISTLGGN